MSPIAKHTRDPIKAPERIMITGASGAIGAALARQYAQPGVTLELLGRRLDALQSTASSCAALGATTHIQRLDLCDRPELMAWLAKMSARKVEDLPDLLVINAGQNHPVTEHQQLEDPVLAHQTLMVNLVSAVDLVNAVVPLMLARGSGQIALISSLAAWRGLPRTPSYSASKAGLKAFGESLRALLAPHGIAVNVVLPGYVQSEMCDAMPGPKPFLWSAKRAAVAIKAGLAANRGRIAFPFWLAIGTQVLGVLPDALAHRLLLLLGYGAAEVSDAVHR